MQRGFAALFILAMAQAPQAAPFAYVLVVSQVSHVAVFDTATNKLVTLIPSGASPVGVAANSSGTRLYVSDSGGTVAVIDTTTNEVVTRIYDTGGGHIAVNPSGTRLYVTSSEALSESGTVVVVDTETNTVVARIPSVGIWPTGIVISPDGRRAYVASIRSPSIAVIDTATNLVAATIRVDGGTSSIIMDAWGYRLYATLPLQYGAGRVVVIDPATGTVEGYVKVGEGPIAIALNPAASRAYVVNWGNEDIPGDTVSVIDTDSLAVVATVWVGGGYPSGVSVHPSGKVVYVANQRNHNMSIIDTATHAVTFTQPLGQVGQWPTAIAQFPVPTNHQGLWWNASESGWGVNLTHQGDVLFATWFTYDTDGSGLWFNMSSGVKTGPATYAGVLDRASGPSFDAMPWNPSGVTHLQAGSATFAFTTPDEGTFSYRVNGIVQSKSITRMKFASPVTTCAAGVRAGTSANYQDLWWRSPGGSESGWGVHIAHQGDTLFGTWFTYGAGGKGQWLSMSNGTRTGNGTYSGALHRTTGPAFDSAAWNPDQVTRTAVGTATFTFLDSENGTFAYVLDGVSRSQPITRLVYASPASVCR